MILSSIHTLWTLRIRQKYFKLSIQLLGNCDLMSIFRNYINHLITLFDFLGIFFYFGIPFSVQTAKQKIVIPPGNGYLLSITKVQKGHWSLTLQ